MRARNISAFWRFTLNRILQAAGLTLLLSVAACSKNPGNTAVGDLGTFEAREPAVFARLSTADQAALANLRTVYKVMSATPSKVIDGTDVTWGDLSEKTATQTVEISRQFFAFTIRSFAAKKVEIDRANAEQARQQAARRAEEKLRMSLVPNIVTEWPKETYCQEIASVDQWRPEQARKDLKEGATLQMVMYSRNLRLLPLVDGEWASPHFPHENTQAYYDYVGYGDPGLVLRDNRLDVGTDPNRLQTWTEWQAKFFESMSSGPLTLAYTIPVEDRPDLVEEGYAFTLTGKNIDGDKTMTLGCRKRRLNDEAQARENARRQEAAEADARRPRSPNERLVESIEAKGGMCTTLGQHLRYHMRYGDETGDWSRFQETLGKAAQVGC